MCVWAVERCLQLIDILGIKDIKEPLPVGFIGRKQAVDFNDTTLETFKKIIPYDIYRVRSHDKEIVIDDKVKIMYGGLDNQQDINKFNSAEFAFIGIDQAEETLRTDVSVLQAALRLTYNGITPAYKELYTANPAECWLKQDFVYGQRPGAIFIPALPDDNPYLPDNYKQTLRQSFAYDDALLRAYLDGDWEAFSNLEDAVFKPPWFETCRKVEDDSDDDFDVKTIACDVATKRGDNYTVIGYRCGNTIVEIVKHRNITATQTATIIKRMYERYSADNIVIDSDGFGEGVSDILTSQKVGVIEFHGGYGAQALDKRRYRNLRSQFYVQTARKVERGIICLSKLDQKTYEELKSQSCSIKYRKPDPLCRYQIETKEDMRGRHVDSPDLTDFLVYSEYGIFMGKEGDTAAYKWR